MDTVQNGMSHNSYCGKTRRIYKVTQHDVGIVINKQEQDFCRDNVCSGHLKLSKSLDSFLKLVKENNYKKKEAKEKGTWVQLIHQSTPHREAHSVRTNGKEPALQESIPYQFMA
ncbi:60S ribosomal protein L21 [Manis javanica]|nr:60S ribosomal protein L21 [Manis javanica]